MAKRRTKFQACNGFSLLELLAVMSIMALLSTLAVTSYFGAIRGMAGRSARQHFLNSLTQARQRACVDGTRMSLMVFNEPTEYDASGKLAKFAPSYVVCKELGRLSFVSGNFLFDEFSDLKQLFGETADSTKVSANYKGGTRLYNLSKGYWVMIKPFVVLKDEGSQGTLLYSDAPYAFKSYAFETMTASWAQSSAAQTWEPGDSYGIEVTPIQSLPKGFTFSGLPNASASDALTRILYVTFAPDGTLYREPGDPSTRTFKIKSSDANVGGASFTVQQDGTIN